MSENYSRDPQEQLSKDILIRYAARELGISEDIALMNVPDMLTVMVSARTERHWALVLPRPEDALNARFAELQLNGALPPHLSTKAAFRERYIELAGFDEESVRDGEVFRQVKAQCSQDPERHKKFEQRLAGFYGEWLSLEIRNHPGIMLGNLLRTTVTYGKRDGKPYLLTGNDLAASLPHQHCGVAQAAAGVNDIFTRAHEARYGAWEHIAFLPTTYFCERLARIAAGSVVGIPPDNVWTSGNSLGLARAAEKLSRAVRERKAFHRGFGAFILSAVNHCGMEQIEAAIDQAPKILARDGVLMLSDLEEFPSGQGSIWQMIDRARRVLGEPESMTVMTDEVDVPVGHQAVFRK